jgi:ribosomal protein L11 methylase PrmA
MKTNNNSGSYPAYPDKGSFRDPSGTVFSRGDRLFRQVNHCYRDQYEALMSSGLYQKLADKNMLVSHREVNEYGYTENAFLVIEPERIPLISYPYEWCFGQLKDAALTTLRIQKAALEKDMILKDASAYNIQFLRGRAMHIDTLSFDFYKEGEPWVAYGQFCRHFLAPLFLMAFTDIRLSLLLRIYIDGVPLDLASKLLKGSRKGGFAARAHIHWHAKSVASHAQAGKNPNSPPRKIKISRFSMTAMIDSLIKTVTKLKLPGAQTEWGDYYSRTNYSDKAADAKKKIAGEYLNDISPAVTWDFGANDGTYSRLALSSDINKAGDRFVAAFDIDPVAVERNYTETKRSRSNMLPLLLDLTNPSPAIGFANRERGRLDMRQKPDCILMLAVIHHLAISNNLPFTIIAEWLSSVCGSLIIEFVPKTDSQVRVLLATRDDIFPDYTEEGFETAFGEYFDILKKHKLPESDRIIYLMKSII